MGALRHLWRRTFPRLRCRAHGHYWVRDGDSLMYVKCRHCDERGIYTGRMEGLADFLPNGGN